MSWTQILGQVAPLLGALTPNILSAFGGDADKAGAPRAAARHPRYKIIKGRRMKWDSKYKGYVPVRRGRRISKEKKLMLAIMLSQSQPQGQGINPLLLSMMI